MSGGTGARVATLVISAFVGLVYGALGTIGHRHTIVIGDVAIPWGLIAALVGVACLVVGLRIIVGRWAAAAAGLGVITAVGLLSLPGFGGSVLIVGDLLGTVWAVGPALIVVLVIAWPNLSTLRRTTTPAAAGA
ncbi:hypothetical protein ACGGZK_10720 [Agromyces sp. MMS24-K17]|uniref:hypothetical protein n=1 Tax=Agromyces sp. MMS24-K17 TaxID=3372850 RepID=UPI0037553329